MTELQTLFPANRLGKRKRDESVEASSKLLEGDSQMTQTLTESGRKTRSNWRSAVDGEIMRGLQEEGLNWDKEGLEVFTTRLIE